MIKKFCLFFVVLVLISGCAALQKIENLPEDGNGDKIFIGGNIKVTAGTENGVRVLKGF